MKNVGFAAVRVEEAHPVPVVVQGNARLSLEEDQEALGLDNGAERDDVRRTAAIPHVIQLPSTQAQGPLAGIVQFDPLVVGISRAVVVPILVLWLGQDFVESDGFRSRRSLCPEGTGVSPVAVSLSGSGEIKVSRCTRDGDRPGIGDSPTGGGGGDEDRAVEQFQGDGLTVGIAEVNAEGDSRRGGDGGAHPSSLGAQRQGQVAVLGGKGAPRPQGSQEVVSGQGRGHDACAVGGVETPVWRLGVSAVGRSHPPADSQGAEISLLEGAVLFPAAVAHFQQGHLLRGRRVVGEIVEAGVVRRAPRVIELGDGLRLGGQPSVETSQGVVRGLFAGDVGIGGEDIAVTLFLGGPLKAPQAHKGPIHGGSLGLSQDVGPLKVVEPVGMISEGQEMHPVGPGHGKGVARGTGTVGISGVRV